MQREPVTVCDPLGVRGRWLVVCTFKVTNCDLEMRFRIGTANAGRIEPRCGHGYSVGRPESGDTSRLSADRIRTIAIKPQPGTAR